MCQVSVDPYSQKLINRHDTNPTLEHKLPPPLNCAIYGKIRHFISKTKTIQIQSMACLNIFEACSPLARNIGWFFYP